MESERYDENVTLKEVHDFCLERHRNLPKHRRCTDGCLYSYVCTEAPLEWGLAPNEFYVFKERKK